jgi:1-acyl-sn-glycerol-3-phosphate acyltransferase
MLSRAIGKNKLPIMIFPEGTSTDGTDVLPFKSSLFAMFYKEDGSAKKGLLVQPVATTWSHSLDKLAWFIKEQSFVDHLLSSVRFMPVEAFITVGEPLSPSDYADRKELAAGAHLKVKELLNV